jgi:hypothetical protein
MAVKNIPITAADTTAQQWAAIAEMVKKAKRVGIVDNGKRVLGVTEKLPGNNPTCHTFIIGDDEFAIVKIPSL